MRRQPIMVYLRYYNMIKQIFLFLFLAFAVSSCCKKNEAAPNLCAEPEIGMGDCITDSNHLKTLILGKWNWTQTKSEAWVTYKANPCTDTFNISFNFQNNNSITIFEKGSQTSTGTYTFFQNYTSSISITDTTPSSHPQLHELSGAVRICGKYLIIDNSPIDGPMQIFLRAE